MIRGRVSSTVLEGKPHPRNATARRGAGRGTAGSGKTYAAKGFVDRLLDISARVAIVDPLGVWWGLRASADGSAAGYPVAMFGGKHADVPITAETGPALGRMIAGEALACVVDLSELGSNAARRRFMAAFSEALRHRPNGLPSGAIGCRRQHQRCCAHSRHKASVTWTRPNSRLCSARNQRRTLEFRGRRLAQ
jgi:hypothetical protein